VLVVMLQTPGSLRVQTGDMVDRCSETWWTHFEYD